MNQNSYLWQEDDAGQRHTLITVKVDSRILQQLSATTAMLLRPVSMPFPFTLSPPVQKHMVSYLTQCSLELTLSSLMAHPWFLYIKFHFTYILQISPYPRDIVYINSKTKLNK